MRNCKILFTLVIVLSVEGCSTVYRQAGLERAPRSDVAVIELDSCGNDCPIIQEIDGAWRGAGSFREYELKPGARNIKFIYMRAGFSGARGLIASFDAKRGTIYSVRANADYSLKEWHPEVVEKSTGEVVSRLVGSGFAY